MSASPAATWTTLLSGDTAAAEAAVRAALSQPQTDADLAAWAELAEAVGDSMSALQAWQTLARRSPDHPTAAGRCTLLSDERTGGGSREPEQAPGLDGPGTGASVVG